MYGVILWSDRSDRKAVIWCEDQGDLAYYQASEHSAAEGASFDAGDLVQFDLREERHLRFARNPKLVAQDYSPDLATDLQRVAPPHSACGPKPTPKASASSNVISFKPRQRQLCNCPVPVSA